MSYAYDGPCYTRRCQAERKRLEKTLRVFARYWPRALRMVELAAAERDALAYNRALVASAFAKVARSPRTLRRLNAAELRALAVILPAHSSTEKLRQLVAARLAKTQEIDRGN